MACAPRGWEAVVAELGTLPFRTELRVCACSVPRPQLAGMRRGLGLPRPGAVEQWRLTLEDGSGLHVVEYPKGVDGSAHYKVHLDEVDPAVDPAEHLRRDAPGVVVWAGAVVGGLCGLVGGAVLGGPLGAYAGAVSGAAAAGRLAAGWVEGGRDADADP